MLSTKWRHLLKETVITFGILISSAMIGTILLILVFLLPTDTMRENVARGTALYNSEGVEAQWAEGYRSTKLDNNTDCIILGNSVNPVTNAVQDAIRVSMTIYEENPDRLQSLLDYVNHVEGKTFTVSYPRYWHGYLVIFKPLLVFFDFSDLRVINMMLQLILTTYCMYLFVQKWKASYLVAFLGLLVVWNPVTIGLSFQYSSCFYITLIAIIILLRNKEYLHQHTNLIKYYFLCIGIITVYFDFLTYPFVTLGIPLSMVLVLEDDNTFLYKLKKIIVNSVDWGIGYAIMWIEKWIIASVILKENIFLDGISQVLIRSSSYSEGDKLTKWDCIKPQLETLTKWPYLLFFMGIFMLFLWKGIKGWQKRTREDIKVNFIEMIKDSIPFLLLCIYPFAWFAVAGNHSYVHPRFAYRELGIAVFALILGATYSYEKHIK